jgi:hypothetical protein
MGTFNCNSMKSKSRGNFSALSYITCHLATTAPTVFRGLPAPSHSWMGYGADSYHASRRAQKNVYSRPQNITIPINETEQYPRHSATSLNTAVARQVFAITTKWTPVFNIAASHLTQQKAIHTNYFDLYVRAAQSWDSEVGIAYGYGLEDVRVGVWVPVTSRIFFTASRPALGSQPRIQWVPGVISSGVKAART